MSHPSQRVANLSPKKRALLEALARERRNVASSPSSEMALPPIEARGFEEPIPLSYSQQRLWFFQRLEPGNPAYNVPDVLVFQGELNYRSLDRTLNEIVRRHAVLRTRFIEVGGEPRQVVEPWRPSALPVVDLSGIHPLLARAAAERLVHRETLVPFDLARDAPLRFHLLRLDGREHMVLSTLHHIVTDAWSKGVLVRELHALYPAFSAGRPSPLPEPRLQYADFARWQRAHIQGAAQDRLVDYWRRYLGTRPAKLELPWDRPRPERQSFRGACERQVLPEPVRAQLHAQTRERGGTLFMPLFAGFQVLLHALSGQDDLVVGCNVANRNHQDTEELIGFFLNMLVLRTDVAGDPTFGELVERVRRNLIGAYAHQDLPFDKLVEALRPDRGLHQQPLFQVKVDFQATGEMAVELPGLTVRPLDRHPGTTHADLSLFLYDTGREVTLLLEYSLDILRGTTVRGWLADLAAVLKAAADKPESRLSELSSLVGEKARQRWANHGQEIETQSRHRLKNRKRRAVRVAR